MAQSKYVIEAKNLVQSYGKNEVLKGLNYFVVKLPNSVKVRLGRGRNAADSMGRGRRHH
jgi:hypothetical protein